MIARIAGGSGRWLAASACAAALLVASLPPDVASAAGASDTAGVEDSSNAEDTAVAAPAEVQLSNDRTLTVWAHPEDTGRIYARPSTSAARVAKVRLYDPDGFPNVYLLLKRYTDAEGREWVKVRIPGRPNGRTGWMLREVLGGFHRTSWRIVVNLGERRMRVYHAGRLLKVFPVGVGKPSTPTPTGHFWIDERFKLSNPSSPYWPYALGTSDYSTLPGWPGEGVVGIHGPYGEPQKIPGDPSHGCIRMLVPDIAWLGPRVTLGTPVDIGP